MYQCLKCSHKFYKKAYIDFENSCPCCGNSKVKNLVNNKIIGGEN